MKCNGNDKLHRVAVAPFLLYKESEAFPFIYDIIIIIIIIVIIIIIIIIIIYWFISYIAGSSLSINTRFVTFNLLHPTGYVMHQQV